MTPLERAIRSVHGSTRLAAAIGEKPSTVGNWHKRGIPLDKCAAIEAATKGAVRCEDLNPDVDWTRDDAGQVTGYHVRVDVPRGVPPAHRSRADWEEGRPSNADLGDEPVGAQRAAKVA